MIHIDNVSLQLNKRQILSNILWIFIRETMEAVGLDQKGVQEIRRLLLSLRARDKIILIASHNAEDIEVLCDRVYEMDNRTLKQNRRRTCLKMNGKDRK